MDVVVEVSVITLPVLTSVMLMRYSVTIPLRLPGKGGDHDREMEVELVGDTVKLSGALDGAIKRRIVVKLKTIMLIYGLISIFLFKGVDKGGGDPPPSF